MWLRRLVGLCMIAACIGLNTLTVLGLVISPKPAPQVAQSVATTRSPVSLGVPPTITLTANPTTITAGGSSALNWTTSANPTSCTASGSWNGDKTAFGSESTGRIPRSGNYTYQLDCSNPAGAAKASVTVTVGNAPPPAKSSTSSSTPSPSASYCGGRLPCYGPREVGQHAASGNCWGWNGDRVINISGFDAAYHEVKSGISSIQISQICGHDLGPSLAGQTSAEGKSHVHNQTTKNNADANEIPYFVGYFDSSKP